MQEDGRNATVTRATHRLNENQQRHLMTSCQYIDRLLSDIDGILHQAESLSPFPRHIVDVTQAQVRMLDAHICRIRRQLVRTIAWQAMQPKPPDIPATRAISSYLAFIDIAVEELKPKHMKGYGTVPGDTVEELNRVVHELHSLVEGMQNYLK